jgi:hypothetical protein
MESFWLFLFMGLIGSAGPGHFGFRVLAYRHHRDRQFAFEKNTEDGGMAYSWWLMRFKFSQFKDSGMNMFAGNAGVMGWITIIGVIGCIIAFMLQKQ